jgi:hypothetical protein
LARAKPASDNDKTAASRALAALMASSFRTCPVSGGA